MVSQLYHLGIETDGPGYRAVTDPNSQLYHLGIETLIPD